MRAVHCCISWFTICIDPDEADQSAYRPVLNHSYMETHERVIGNSAGPDQMPPNVASDHGLQCLLAGFSIKNRIKATK